MREKTYHANSEHKKDGEALLISDKIDFKARKLQRQEKVKTEQSQIFDT